MGCKRCHKECSACTSDGAFCVKCINVKQNGQCVEKCSSSYYYDKVNQVCSPCDKRCTECTGPTNQNCLSCFHYKLFKEYDEFSHENETTEQGSFFSPSSLSSESRLEDPVGDKHENNNSQIEDPDLAKRANNASQVEDSVRDPEVSSSLFLQPFYLPHFTVVFGIYLGKTLFILLIYVQNAIFISFNLLQN